MQHFGSLLQNYALKKMLEEAGCYVDFLNFEPNASDNALLNGMVQTYREDREKTHTFFSKVSRYDLCLIGSDKVFKCLSSTQWGVTGQLFGDIPQVKRVASYAASCGSTTLANVPDQVAKRISESFEKVSLFSVKYAKRFAILVRDSNRNKLEDLIDRLQLQQHRIRSYQLLEGVYQVQKDEARLQSLFKEGKRPDNAVFTLCLCRGWK